MPTLIRLAQPTDAEAITSIYAPFCQDSIVSFELTPPAPAEMAERIHKISARLPWLVLEDDDQVIGYTYASSHRDRAAYQWSADVSAYIHADHRRQGIGRALYTTLFALLRAQGFYKAYAGITLPNPNSEGLHAALGFQPVGVYRGVGYKLGAWQDVGWYQRPLQPEQLNPIPPLPIDQILNTPQWAQAVADGLPYYRRQPAP
jgi:L-amino acid N-acyltransferase YncA